MFLNNWAGGDAGEVARAFGLSDEDLAGVEILLASYGSADYEAEAFVLFRRDGQLFEVNGSHGSMDCLAKDQWDYPQSQWEPEETSVEALRDRMACGLGHGNGNNFTKELAEVLDRIASQ